MHPILFNLGSLSITSFGFFLALAFLSAVFILWRLAKVYDLKEEKILDLAILTFIGGIIGARVYFVATNWEIFQSLSRAVLINKYPGLSLWGGFIGGSLIFWAALRKTRLSFWQIADFAATGSILGLFWGDLGCLLGGCGFGGVSNLPLSVSVVGLVGKRFPLPAVEAIVFLLIFSYLWSQVIRFHFAGKIVALSLIFFGLVKVVMEFFQVGLNLSELAPLVIFVLGVMVFYQRSKRNLLADVRAFLGLFSSGKQRKLVLSNVKKNWYNYLITWRVRLGKTKTLLPRILKRRLNVRPTPKNII